MNRLVLPPIPKRLNPPVHLCCHIGCEPFSAGALRKLFTRGQNSTHAITKRNATKPKKGSIAPNESVEKLTGCFYIQDRTIFVPVFALLREILRSSLRKFCCFSNRRAFLNFSQYGRGFFYRLNAQSRRRAALGCLCLLCASSFCNQEDADCNE